MIKRMVKNLAVIFSVALTGCATSMTSDRVVTNTYSSDVADRVVRSVADRNEWNPDVNPWTNWDASPGPALLQKTNWTDNAKRYRWANTSVKTGTAHYSGMLVFSFSLIADGVPSIEKGDIVDVSYKHETYSYDLDRLKSNKVIKLVCKGSDSKCIADLKKSNKWGVSSGYEITSYSKEFLDSLTYTPVR